MSWVTLVTLRTILSHDSGAVLRTRKPSLWTSGHVSRQIPYTCPEPLINNPACPITPSLTPSESCIWRAVSFLSSPHHPQKIIIFSNSQQRAIFFKAAIKIQNGYHMSYFFVGITTVILLIISCTSCKCKLIGILYLSCLFSDVKLYLSWINVAKLCGWVEISSY